MRKRLRIYPHPLLFREPPPGWPEKTNGYSPCSTSPFICVCLFYQSSFSDVLFQSYFHGDNRSRYQEKLNSNDNRSYLPNSRSIFIHHKNKRKYGQRQQHQTAPKPQLSNHFMRKLPCTPVLHRHSRPIPKKQVDVFWSLGHEYLPKADHCERYKQSHDEHKKPKCHDSISFKPLSCLTLSPCSKKFGVEIPERRFTIARIRCIILKRKTTN